MGVWVMAVIAWVISTGYFLFLPRRLMISVHFYRALFPERGVLHAVGCTWRQYHAFAARYSERLLLEDHGSIHYESDGWEHLNEASDSGTGGIILMSHLGNWEIAARLFQRRGLDLLLYVQARQQEQIDRMLKADVQQEGVKILATSGQDDVFNGLEGLRFLRQGGFISLAGDRARAGDDQKVTVRFLDHQVQLPRAPYVLALLSGAPIFIFFAVRTGRRRYRFIATPPYWVKPASRADRSRAIQDAAQEYAAILEEVLRRYPTQWYAFEPFLGPAWRER